MDTTEFAKLLYETKVPSSLPAEVVQKIYEPVLQYISDESPKRLYRYIHLFFMRLQCRMACDRFESIEARMLFH